ncbi:hypothetical protein QBC40DRAFT_299117 [Triangularia verruculosa]|uniref:Uncharacterized protein n=1 Tax=Triangularia verruculosa TaxID=2587418 RepID=A0AAN6XH69_9PEZI|nr:hypothetical protein QBC40DRAFT_299117 [Triangularia verruculosa]
MSVQVGTGLKRCIVPRAVAMLCKHQEKAPPAEPMWGTVQEGAQEVVVLCTVAPISYPSNSSLLEDVHVGRHSDMITTGDFGCLLQNQCRMAGQVPKSSMMHSWSLPERHTLCTVSRLGVVPAAHCFPFSWTPNCRTSVARGGQSAPLRNALAMHQHPQDPPNCGQRQGTSGVVAHELHIGLQCSGDSSRVCGSLWCSSPQQSGDGGLERPRVPWVLLASRKVRMGDAEKLVPRSCRTCFTAALHTDNGKALAFFYQLGTAMNSRNAAERLLRTEWIIRCGVGGVGGRMTRESVLSRDWVDCRSGERLTGEGPPDPPSAWEWVGGLVDSVPSLFAFPS